MNRISFLNRGYAFKGLLAVIDGLVCENKAILCYTELMQV